MITMKGGNDMDIDQEIADLKAKIKVTQSSIKSHEANLKQLRADIHWMYKKLYELEPKVVKVTKVEPKTMTLDEYHLHQRDQYRL